MTASTPGGLSTSATGAGTSSSPGTQTPIAAALERSIARLLTVGTYVSIGLLAVGFGLLLAAGLGPRSGGPAFDPSTLVSDLSATRPAGFLWLGLLLLVATPAARVGLALVGYGRGGERAMTVVAAAILVVIGLSVVLGSGLEA